MKCVVKAAKLVVIVLGNLPVGIDLLDDELSRSRVESMLYRFHFFVHGSTRGDLGINAVGFRRSSSRDFNGGHCVENVLKRERGKGYGDRILGMLNLVFLICLAIFLQLAGALFADCWKVA